MNDRRLLHSAAVALVVGLALVPVSAHAYIDPGSAGFVVTTVLGAAAAAGYLIRGWLGAAASWLRGLGRRGASDDQSADQPTEEGVPSTRTTMNERLPRLDREVPR